MGQGCVVAHTEQRCHRKIRRAHGDRHLAIEGIQSLGQPAILREPLDIRGALQKEKQEGGQ